MKRFAICGAAVAALGALSLLVPTSSPARAQEGDVKKLALLAKEILEKNCVKCHGAQRKSGTLDVRSHKSMVEKRAEDTYVVPKKLEESYVWARVGKTKDMPPAGPISDDEQKVVKAWIEAGAPDWAEGAAAPKREYVSVEKMLTYILSDLREAEEEDRPYLRYFTMTHLHNNPNVSEDQLGLYRAAVSKVLNSLHWRKPIILPRQVDKEGTVFAIDIRDLDWDRKRVLVNGRYEYEKSDRWAIIQQYYDYGLVYEDRDNPRVERLFRDIQKETRKNKIIMRGDWFVARATRPPVYNQVLRLPNYAGELEEKLGVNVAENFRRNRLKRAGYRHSGVSSQNRLVERHDSLYGAYWKSYDFKKGGDKASLTRFPLGPIAFESAYSGKKYPYLDVAFRHDGGEMIFHLPNSMQAYFLVNGKDQFIPAGPPDVVHDPENRSGTAEIVNGISCIACHKNGMIESVKDEVRNGAELDGDIMRKVRQIYVPRPEFMKLVERDRDQFLRAVEESVRPFLGNTKYKAMTTVTLPEPLHELIKDYHLDLDLDRVAYELGYSTEAIPELRGAIKNNEKLAFLRTLISKDRGGVKRDDWDNGGNFLDKDRISGSYLQKAAYALGLGAGR